MERSRLSRAIAASFLGVGVASCTLLTGVGDLSVEDAVDAQAVVETSTPPKPDTGPVATPPVDSGADVEAPTDAEVPADADADASCSSVGCFDVKPPFEIVAFGPKVGCPTGFGPFNDYVEDPVVGANACPCSSCNMTSQPSCPATGQMPTMFDNSASTGVCGTNGGTTSAACSADGFLGPFDAENEHRYAPPPGAPTGGSCVAPVTKDTSKLNVTDGRSCKAGKLPSCEGKVCPPSVASPFKVCVAASGDRACPAGFPDKHTMGTGASFTCSGGTCSCTVNPGSCESGKLLFYTSSPVLGCIGFPALVVDVNETCVPTVSNPPGATYGSHRYVPNPPTNVTCSASGTGAATAPTLTGPTTTICCQ